MESRPTAITIRTDDLLNGFFGAIFDYFDTRPSDSDGPGHAGANGDRNMASDAGANTDENPETILLQRRKEGRWHIVRSAQSDAGSSADARSDGQPALLRHCDGNDRTGLQEHPYVMHRRCGRCVYPACDCPNPESDCERCGALEVE